MTTYYQAINWNEIEDVIDKSTWEKLTEQFWLDTRIPLSNDLDDWRKLSCPRKRSCGQVFGGLTLLDTMQSQLVWKLFVRMYALLTKKQSLTTSNSWNPFMPNLILQSFSTLNTKKEIEDIFEWTNNNEYLQKKAKIINDIYENGTAFTKKGSVNLS